MEGSASFRHPFCHWFDHVVRLSLHRVGYTMHEEVEEDEAAAAEEEEKGEQRMKENEDKFNIKVIDSNKPSRAPIDPGPPGQINNSDIVVTSNKPTRPPIDPGPPGQTN